MDFAPMSLRMMVPHANDVGELQHNMNQQAAMQQDFKALQQKKLIERQQSQVRTKDDAGVIALLDERFMQNSYKKMFPAEWKRVHAVGSSEMYVYAKSFWESL